MKLTRKILLNPGPVTTTDSVKNALVVPDICHREHEFSELIQKVRRNIKEVVHANDNYTSILFASSGTGAVEATISSVVPFEKKLLVIKNGVYSQRIIEIARKFNIQVVTLDVSPFERPSLEILNNMLNADADISAVAMVHHETSTGLLNPLVEVGEVVKKFSKTFIVDAISSYAGININIANAHVDYLIATSNKCLQGIPGISFVIANIEHLTKHKDMSRGFYFDLYQQYQSLEKQHVLRFTPPVQVVYALSQALDEYFREGEFVRFERYSENYRTLMEGLSQLNFEFPVPKELQSQLLILTTFPVDKAYISFSVLHDQLYARGYTIYPASLNSDHAIRLACFGDINKNDIQNFIKELTYLLETL